MATITPERERDGRFISPRRPTDFEATFIAIGRQACEEHYRVARITVTRWLEECGKDRLLQARAENAAKRGRVGRGTVARYGRETVDGWLGKMTCQEMSTVLHRAFPPRQHVSFTLARHAAQHLRVMRNGGFRVSPAGNGDWRIGIRTITAAELVAFAVSKGFDPASLTWLENTKVD